MPSVIKLAVKSITDTKMQALRQFLRNQARAQIPGTLCEIAGQLNERSLI